MIRTVDELSAEAFSPELFTKHYFFANRPVVVRGLFLDDKTEKDWTLDFLLSQVAGSEQKVGVAIYEKRENKHEQFYDTYKEEEMTVSEALKLASADPEASGLFHNLLEAAIPELIEPLNIPAFLSDKTANTDGNLWIGNGNITRVHFDMPNNFYFQIKGRKTFHLYEPANYFYLYPSGSNASAIDDVENIDFEKFPMARQAEKIEVTLEPGDFLYMPPFWWHQVESQDPYISLNYWGNPRIDQVLCHPGYYEFVKHWDLGVLVQMYEMCNRTGFEDYTFSDAIQFIQYKGYHWASFLLAISWLQQELLSVCRAHDIALDPSIDQRTADLLGQMDLQEVDHNKIMFVTLGEDRFLETIQKLKEAAVIDQETTDVLYRFLSFVKPAKNKDNVAVSPALVNELLLFTQRVNTWQPEEVPA